jgi:hypothetical protein
LILNTEEHFSFFDPVYPTPGLTVTGLEGVYSIFIKLNLVSQNTKVYRTIWKRTSYIFPPCGKNSPVVPMACLEARGLFMALL